MRELMRSNDLVLMSFAEALLRDAGVGVMVADTNMSVLEGSIGALPRRLMVNTDQLAIARRVMEEADLGEWVSRDALP